MSVAALLLAAALLCGAGPRSARARAGLLARRDTRVSGRPGRYCSTDPFAVASTLDVLAVCLGAGMSVANAAAATAPSAPPAVRAVLQRAADLLALGADPETAWSVDSHDVDLEALMRLARRSASSGSALTHGVTELADQLRQDAAHAAAAAAARAGVLGLCFLPAFVCLGIVPVVAGLAADVLGSVIV